MAPRGGPFYGKKEVRYRTAKVDICDFHKGNRTNIIAHDIINFMQQHRKKVNYVEIAEAFKENKKEIEDLSYIFDDHDDYLESLKENVNWAMERLTGKSVKEKEIIEDFILGCIDVLSTSYQQARGDYKLICGIMNPRQDSKGVYVSPKDIEVAKSYPVENLIEFKNGFRECIFHKEKTASMKLYEDSNTVYCFGCHKFADSIGVYMHINGVDFKTAVKQLNNGNN